LDDPEVGTNDITVSFSGFTDSAVTATSLSGLAAGQPSSFASATDSPLENGETELQLELVINNPAGVVFGAYTQQRGFHEALNPEGFTDLYRGDSGSSNSSVGYEVQEASENKVFQWTAPQDTLSTSNAAVLAAFPAASQQ